MDPSVSAATYLFSQLARPFSTNTSATAFPAIPPPVMIIQLVARNTSKSFTCAQENSYCLSAQINNFDSSPTTGATHTPFLTRRNLIGVLIIAALFVLGFALWLCFGKWSKPIRHFFKGKSRSSPSRPSNGATPFRIGDDPKAVAAPRKVLPGSEGANVEKAEIMDSSSSSTQSSLLDQDAIKINDVELALPAKVLKIKSGSRLASLIR
ncbi:hypothetical protein BJY52DRAFT_233890 [Lactarius psammicola]|nr:hypothetical protein BJY52DRAFT_233890 [Lactarius psammicola]